MTNKSLFAATIIVAFLTLCSCNDKVSPYEDDPEYGARKYLAGRCIDTLYYWNDEVRAKNKSVQLNQNTIQELFSSLLYSGDRWSWMEDGESFTQSQTGVVTDTWGVSFSQPYDMDFTNSQGMTVEGDPQKYQLHIRFIYPGSPLEAAGVTRGATLKGIGDSKDNLVIFDELASDEFYSLIDVSPQTFTFTLADGRDTTFTASKVSSLSSSPVHLVKVFDDNDFAGLSEPVGYINYLSFKAEPFLDDLSEAFRTVKDSGAKKIILDFRYNTGGYSSATNLMMNNLATKDMAGQIYVSYNHNKLLSSLDDSLTLDGDTDSGLESVYVITGGHTASASEVVINALRPYFKENLHLVGGKTYGKPNGMYVCIYPTNAEKYSDIDYVFYPISYYNKNSKGESIPDDGFDPDNSRPDDLFSDWGADEDLTYACLYHIVNGSYPATRKHAAMDMTKSSFQNKSGATLADDINISEGGYKEMPK